VGRKTANVVMNTAFGAETFAVDTHIFRVGNRAGIAPGKNVVAVEKALEKSTPGFTKALMQAEPSRALRLSDAQVGVAYWAAASWGAYIALSKDDPDAVADLPLAVRLAELAWRTTPDHGQGTLTSLMGSFEAARPGGSMAKAAAFFDQAFAISGNQNPGPLVAKAEAIAQAAGDRPAFEALLQQALTVSAKRNDLASQIMRQRARWLLDNADDLF
jgi:predicted anti-sigma-YlaC factor YlaD